MLYVLRDTQLDGATSVSDIKINTIGIIENYASLIWNMQYSGQGDFQLITGFSEEYMKLLKTGNYLVRDFDWSSDLCINVMAIQKIDITYDEEYGLQIKATGKSLKSYILGKRVIKYQENLKGDAWTKIKNLIAAQFWNDRSESGDRIIINLMIQDVTGLTNTIDTQVYCTNLAEWMEEICNVYKWGWDMDIENDKYKFYVYVGKDRSTDQSVNMPIIFSKVYDNLYSVDYSEDQSNVHNVAYIYGEELSDKSRIRVKYEKAEHIKGLFRNEKGIDSSLTSTDGEATITRSEYISILQNEGKQELNQENPYELQATIEANGIYKLNEDYFLGDIVSVITDYGISAKSRIIEVIYAEDENGTSIVPTFSEWAVEEEE